jgi:hypothetical protein
MVLSGDRVSWFGATHGDLRTSWKRDSEIKRGAPRQPAGATGQS